MTELEKAADRISFLYGKILDNQDWDISELDELLDLSRKDGIEWQQARQSPWVSVEERLPETNNRYITVDRGVTPAEYDICDYHCSAGVWLDHFGDQAHPTHWMPIPETP